MKKKPYYLKCYREWLLYGMPNSGLCLYFDEIPKAARELKMFHPTPADERRGGINLDWAGNPNYWGSGDLCGMQYEFTPLRQTIVLFLAAMNNEL